MSAQKILVNLGLLIYYWLESMVLAFVPKRMRFKSVEGQNVLITGGGSGIGRLLALRFAQHGARIIVWDINLDGARETAKLVEETGGKAYAFECDISQPKRVYEAAAKTKAEAGKVDILVNNAGIVSGKRLMDLTDKQIQMTFEVNAMSHFWTCKAFLPDMMSENSGHLVSVASLAGMNGIVRLTDYCASKFAAVGLEESLRLELHSEGYTGIKSTVVCPYFINTGMFEGADSGIFPFLTPEYVADEIVAGVLVNQEVIVLPKYFNVFLFLKSLFSSKCYREIGYIALFSRAMMTFTGHQVGSVGARNGVGVSVNNNDDTKTKCL